MVYTKYSNNDEEINGGAYSQIKMKNEKKTNTEIDKQKNQTIVNIPTRTNNYNETEEKLKKFINFKFK